MPCRERGRPFWSKWVWKDWEVKTRDLSPHEYTAYHRLLSYAATCSPDMCSIPDDDVRLARAAGMGLKRWLSVREKVLDYFLPVNGRYIHDRLRTDAVRFLQLVENNTSRVYRRYNQTATMRAGVRSKKLEVSIEEESNQHILLTGVSETEKKPSAKDEWTESFPDWWTLYPRKVSRKAALRAWCSQKPWSQDHLDAIFAGTEKWAKWWSDNEKAMEFIPHPATFLNQQRYREDPT